MAPPRPPRLTFRTADTRGDVLDLPKVCPGKALIGRRDLVLLIHGFNNNKQEAEDAYEGFQSLQRKLGGLTDDQPVADGKLVEFYWPGDVGLFPAKNYEDSLERAIAIARKLPDALRRAVGHADPIQIDVVAHSMGCRLTLETLRWLAASPHIFVRRAAFLAAAVPTFLLDPPERLRAGMESSRIEKVMSLFSGSDLVLDKAFPLGQWDAQGERWTQGDEWRKGVTVALGHECWIAANPSPILDRSSQIQISLAGHSDYWGYKADTRKQQGTWSNTLVKDFLGFAAAGPRVTPTRVQPGRDIAPTRTAEVRGQPDRKADGSEGDQCIAV